MVANDKWIEFFQQAKVHHRSMSSSDHCLLALYPIPVQRMRRDKALFRFESMWARDEKCRDEVELAWSFVNPSGERSLTQEKIKNCQHHLQWWSKKCLWQSQ